MRKKSAKAEQRNYNARSDRASGEKMKEHIEKLQKYIEEQGIDAYVVFTSDDHGSEYVVDHFKARAPKTARICGRTEDISFRRKPNSKKAERNL